MTTTINLLANDIWTEQDILARGRALIAAQVSSVRQQELQTILLGHLTQERTTTDEELAEIALVGQITRAQSAENDLVRADMALLTEVMAYESTGEGELSDGAQVLYVLRNPTPVEVSE